MPGFLMFEAACCGDDSAWAAWNSEGNERRETGMGNV